MTTEREFLGYDSPAPAKDWAEALSQAGHHFDEAARLAAHGDIHGALVSAATGVGLAAEAAQLEHDEADDDDEVVADEIVTIGGTAVRIDPRRPDVAYLDISIGSPTLHPAVRVDPLSLSTEEFMAAMADEEDADQTRDLLDGGAR